MIRLLALLACLAGVMSAATPAHQLALTSQNRNCDGSDAGPPSSTSAGFVNLVRVGSTGSPGANKLVVNVVLQGAEIGTYNVRIVQVYPGIPLTDCPGSQGTLVTDSLGNANGNFQEAPVRSDATAALVVLNNLDPAKSGAFYTTPALTF